MKQSSGFIGQRLTEARELRGLTAAALSQALNISRQSVYKYENGLQSPSEETLQRICQELNLPDKFFVSSRLYRYTDKTPIFYRSFASTTQRLRKKAEQKFNLLKDVVTFLEDYVDFPWVNLPQEDRFVFKNEEELIDITQAEIESVAMKVRDLWGLGYGPISNIVWLLENNGIIIGRCSINSKSVDAFSQRLLHRPMVMLNSYKSCARSRFDLAHELGHLIMHRSVEPRWLENKEYLKKIEEQANYFAGAFLFPEPAFKREVRSASLDLFKNLKRRWNLSIGMMIQRTIQLDMIPGEEVDKFWRNYTRRGWRITEPFDNEVPLECPKLLQAGFNLLLSEGIFSKSMILSALNHSSSDIEEVACLPDHFFEGSDEPKIRLKANDYSEPALEGLLHKSSDNVVSMARFRKS